MDGGEGEMLMKSNFYYEPRCILAGIYLSFHFSFFVKPWDVVIVQYSGFRYRGVAGGYD